MSKPLVENTNTYQTLTSKLTSEENLARRLSFLRMKHAKELGKNARFLVGFMIR